MTARAIAIALAIAGASCHPSASPTPAPTPRAKPIAQPLAIALPDDPTHTTIHRLSNGMTVYLSPDTAEPTIVAHIVVRAGSAYDPETSTGLAHYLEHMVLFKGTNQLGTLDYAAEKPSLDRIAALYAALRDPGVDRAATLAAIDAETQRAARVEIPNELDQLYHRMGITSINAFTDVDQTGYVATIPKNRIAQWARVEADRFRDPVFRLFWPELEAVYEEKNRGLDNPGRRAYDAMMAALFAHHGYGRDTLGEIEHLKTPAYADMLAFFARYYAPDNMAILLAGDVDDSVLPILEATLGRWHKAPGAPHPATPIAPIAARTEVTVPVPSTPGVTIAWQLPAATAADRDALEVMDAVLLEGNFGILSRDLIAVQRVADAGCSPTWLREAGYYTLWANALAGQTPEALEALLLAEVTELQRGGFTADDVAAAVLHLEMDDEAGRESNEGRMARIQEAFVRGEDWARVVRRGSRWRAVTVADVSRVATTYLTPSAIVVRRVVGEAAPPKIAKPTITPVAVDPSRTSAYATSVLAMPAAPIAPVPLAVGRDYQRWSSTAGEVVTVHNPRNGLFALTYRYELGRVDDALACFALETLPSSNLPDKTFAELARELYALGISVWTSCGREYATITVSGADANLERGLALVRARLATATVDAAFLAARLATARTERANDKASPASVARALASYARYDRAIDTLVVPSDRELAAVTPARVAAVFQRFLHARHRTAYFGPRVLTREQDATIALGDGAVATTPRAPATLRAIAAPGDVFVAHQVTAQTQIWMTWPRSPADEADRAIGRVFGEYFGQRVYQEIRVARGLAYTAYGGYEPMGRPVDDAFAYVYVGTQGDKTHDAIDAVRAVLVQPIDPAAFAIAKETIAESYRVSRIAPRDVAATVYAWEDQGQPADPRAARAARAAAIDRDQLVAWRDAAFGRPSIVSIAGDRAKLTQARLAPLGRVVEIPIAHLFGY